MTASDPSESKGATIGPYRVLDSIGSGGMGKVFKVTDSTGRVLALKLLGAAGRSDQALERFRREGELTAALAHPNVVAVHGCGEHSGHPYLVYEFVQGRDLSQAHGLSRDRELEIVCDVARGVAHAHERGIVHRSHSLGWCCWSIRGPMSECTA